MTLLFYRSWRLWVLAVGMILALGTTALLTIARQEDPTITNLFATIVTPYPGADPARVESLVSEPIERRLREIAEIDTISSTSGTGISTVQIELSAFVPDDRLEQVWSEIRDALDDVERSLPDGAGPADFDDDRTGAYTAILALQPRADRVVPPAVLARYATDLRDRLRSVPGTRLVDALGVPEEEVLVEIDPARLTDLGLTVGDVTRALAAADAKVRAGTVRGDQGDLQIELRGAFESLERIRAVPVTQSADGPVVRVGDVARLDRAVAEPPADIALIDGRPGVLLALRMEDGLRVDQWSRAALAAAYAYGERLPDGLTLRTVFDQAAYTEARLAGVLENMALGVAIVIAVLLLTLGWRSAVVVAFALPLTALSSLAVLGWIGVPVHQMSVTGMIVALGLLVDAAIVMTDEIRQRLAKDGDRAGAVNFAIRRLAVPLLASTVTTILAFMPMATLPGPAGDFVGSIALAVIVMLSTSLLIALTITPALAGWMLAERGGGRLSWLSHGLPGGPLGRAFHWSLRLSLRHRVLAVMAALVLPLLGFASFPTLTAQFFPGVDRDQFYVEVTAPAGSSIRRTEALALQIGAVLRADPAVTDVQWVVGGDAPAFYYNMLANRDSQPAFAEALVTTTGEAATLDALPRLQDELDRRFPGAQILVRGLVQGPPVDAPVELRLVGQDLETLRALGDRYRAVMAEVPEILHTRASLSGGEPKLEFVPDEEAIRLLGLDLGAVAGQLDALLGGGTGGSLVEATTELPVRVRLPNDVRADMGRLATVPIVPQGIGALSAAELYPGVPLSAIGRFELVPADPPIARRNGERVNTIQAYIVAGVLPEEALEGLMQRLQADPIALPSGYRLETGGDSDARAETVSNLISTLGIVVTLTIATIVLTFRSFRLSLAALVVSVLSMGLSILSLAVAGYPFGINALIGVIGSIGVSINAAIIIMTALQEDEAARAGDPNAIAGVVMGAARHIVSTTVTTFGGFLPLILEGGGFWPPFATAIAGGVLLSTVVSFYFTPPVFSLLMAPLGLRQTDNADPARNAGEAGADTVLQPRAA